LALCHGTPLWAPCMRLLAWCNTSDFDPSNVGFVL
jgi:hypothetical protein